MYPGEAEKAHSAATPLFYLIMTINVKKLTIKCNV